MEELENPVKPPNYKELPRKEKKALRKEYRQINPRSKIWLTVLIFSFALGLTGAILMTADFADKNKTLTILAFVFYVTFFIVICVNTSLQNSRERKFYEWLKETKGIVRR